MAEIDLPPRQGVAFAAKRHLHHARVEAVLRHPAGDGFDEILQRVRETARRKQVLGARLKKSRAKFDGQLLGDPPHALARLLRREVAPFFVFLPQPFVVTLERLMLETPPFARFGLEEFPFLRAQAGMDEKLERTSRELLEAAH